MDTIVSLQNLLDEYKDQRVVVIGTTCTGKSTFVKQLTGACDMDELLFPLLTKEEIEYVSQTPWITEIGSTMTQLARERVKVEPGKPVFGTVVLDVDHVVYLKISDKLLCERTSHRRASFDDAKNMQSYIERQTAESGLPVIELTVG